MIKWTKFTTAQPQPGDGILLVWMADGTGSMVGDDGSVKNLTGFMFHNGRFWELHYAGLEFGKPTHWAKTTAPNGAGDPDAAPDFMPVPLKAG